MELINKSFHFTKKNRKNQSGPYTPCTWQILKMLEYRGFNIEFSFRIGQFRVDENKSSFLQKSFWRQNNLETADFPENDAKDFGAFQ